MSVVRRIAGRILSIIIGGVLAFTLVYSVLFPQPAATALADPEVQVILKVPDNVSPGANFTANVSISNVVNLDATNYDIIFDPAVLKLNNVANGIIGGKTITIDAWNQREEGTYTIVQNVPGLDGASGSGNLAFLQFQVIGSLSQSTSLNLSNHVLSSTLATEIPATWTGALIQAVAPPPTSQANFSVSGFSIAPRQVYPDEPVTVSFLLTNSGGKAGEYTAIMKVNGAKESEQVINLGGSQIRTIVFRVTRSAAGAYGVDVNGQTGQFTVITRPVFTSSSGTVTSPPPATDNTTNTTNTTNIANNDGIESQTPSSEPTSSPSNPVNATQPAEPVQSGTSEVSATNPSPAPGVVSVTTTTSASPESQPRRINLPLVGFTIGGGVVIAIGLLVFFIVLRR